jgi:cobalt-zinc-cadmium efflux system outer membrane protein
VLRRLRHPPGTNPHHLALNTPNTPDSPISLRAALDAAWALHPASRASANRSAELQARARAAQSLVSGSPSVGLAHRTDVLSGGAGLREYEAEVAVPLWNPGVRGATQNQVSADISALDWQQSAERLKLAGEIRAAAAQVALARAEREWAARKHLEATELANDVERRVSRRNPGCHASACTTAGTPTGATCGADPRTGQWRALTGQTQVANLMSPCLRGRTERTPSPSSAGQSARARLALTEADRRDPMELGLGVTRERAAVGANPETSVRFALRIPWGGDNRNAAKLAAALAELDTAQAQADAAVRQLDADIASAHAGLDAARQQEALAAQRATLSTQIQALVAKSHRWVKATCRFRCA